MKGLNNRENHRGESAKEGTEGGLREKALAREKWMEEGNGREGKGKPKLPRNGNRRK